MRGRRNPVIYGENEMLYDDMVEKIIKENEEEAKAYRKLRREYLAGCALI